MRSTWSTADNAFEWVRISRALFLLVFTCFAIALGLGLQVDSSVGKLGVLGAEWVATKLTQPIRIVASVALTPLVAQILKIRRKPDSCP
jgi:hypothetical protein